MKYKTINGETLRKALLSAQSNLEANKDLVNGLNVFPVPDGDTGTNMGLTVSSAIKHLRELENPTIAEVAKAAGAGALMGARGNSGVILSQLFRGFASGMKGLEKADVADMARALDMAAKMAYKAVMRPTEGTVLTVARVMGEFALQNYKKYDDVTMFLTDVREKGEETLEKTPEMLAVLAEAGVVDAGGKGLLCLFEGALAYLKTGKEAVAKPAPAPVTVQKTSAPAESSVDIPFGYCTEFMIMGNSAGFEKFRDELETFGDSIVAVQGDDVIKIHIHTNHPGQVLEKAMALGALNDIKIDNMRFQHEHLLADDEEVAAASQAARSEEPTKKYGFVTVASGEGLYEIFNDLQVDEVIRGGQTMNPSTEDFIQCIDRIHAETIILLPNNSNIILAANQAKALSKKDIVVVPSKTVPQGFAAMIAFDYDATPEENASAMAEAVASVKSGEVTFAVRDTKVNGITIHKDDVIGILDGTIVTSRKSVEDAAKDVIQNAVDEDTSLITLFYGEEVKDVTAKAFAEKLEDIYTDYEVETVHGGQPLYYYLISVE